LRSLPFRFRKECREEIQNAANWRLDVKLPDEVSDMEIVLWIPPRSMQMLFSLHCLQALQKAWKQIRKRGFCGGK
jgi:hypothetical protein